MLSLSTPRRRSGMPRYSLLRHCRTLVASPGFATLLAVAGGVGGYAWRH